MKIFNFFEALSWPFGILILNPCVKNYLMICYHRFIILKDDLNGAITKLKDIVVFFKKRKNIDSSPKVKLVKLVISDFMYKHKIPLPFSTYVEQNIFSLPIFYYVKTIIKFSISFVLKKTV